MIDLINVRTDQGVFSTKAVRITPYLALTRSTEKGMFSLTHTKTGKSLYRSPDFLLLYYLGKALERMNWDWDDENSAACQECLDALMLTGRMLIQEVKKL